ncbi:HAMP domain-containing histidine kinase [Fulvivirga sp. M361]|uniref:sensor histidine kinase n=1 Tax=Fulvivirga sp. M361 TaxID=2594266 RepID=UPI001179CF44|nr:HAMP domain-containing histidine kinase [Fulvivirga sp. M361]TRX47198.1 HAMP domain-containing histidine kinase [Fulvivirga sp. M361]
MNQELKKDDSHSRHWTLKLERGSSIFNSGSDIGQTLRKLNEAPGQTHADTIYEFIDFQKLLSKVVKQAHVLAYDQLEVAVSIEQPYAFYGDLNNIERALLHLIFGAINSLDPGKNECIVDIDIDVGREETMIEIVDNGKGNIPNYPFVKSDKGSSLYLEPVISCIKLFSGQLNIRSSPGVGSHIVLRIPSNQEKQI